MEYKEWALAEGYVPQKLDSVYGFDEAKEYFNKYELVNPIHVIEFSAFEKLQKDWEQAATRNYADKCEIEKLKKQNEVMREALKFYANGFNWQHISPDKFEYRVMTSSDMGSGEFQITDMTDDEWVCGKTARQALAKVDEIERGEG